MKNIKRVIMMTVAAVVMAAPAMANSPVVKHTVEYVKGPDIVVNTDMYGNISKEEFLNYQAKRYDEAMANSRHGRVAFDGRVVSKDAFLFDQSQKFDDLDSLNSGKISRASFEALEVTSIEPAGGPAMRAVRSTSRPPANNQLVNTNHISGGADGAGGWTAQ